MSEPQYWPEVLTETCPTCGRERYWSSTEANAENCPPAGHTIRKAPDGSRYDTCPMAPDRMETT